MSLAALYVLTVLVALSLGGASAWQVQNWRYGSLISTAALVEAQARARAASQVAAAEQALQTSKHNQEVLDDQNQKTTAALSARLRGAVALTGRLRDPGAAGCPADPAAPAAPAGAGAADGAADTGLFSAGATELLQRLTREADEINDAYASCRADGQSVRQ